MANTKKRDGRKGRVLFVRVGWMHFYAGPIPGDERPIGGGKYNQSNIGHEIYNFYGSGDRLYGYVQPPVRSDAIALERIDSGATFADKLEHVLVVITARRPSGGQVIVGWYRDAEVHRKRVLQSPGKPRGNGHFFSATRRNCVLLPDENRRFEVPFGKGGMGQSNVFYPLARDGTRKEFDWIEEALDFVDDYSAGDLISDPEIDAERESADAVEKALARSQGQGFARTAEQRRAIELHAMKAAKKYFKQRGFDVADVSARRPYDLECKQAGVELHVEVKGTTTDGETIVLTRNEVRHANGSANDCALFVLYSIKLKGKTASGGLQKFIEPWEPQNSRLTPISYTYRLR